MKFDETDILFFKWRTATLTVYLLCCSFAAGEQWSLRMLSSIMSRQQGIVSSGQASSTLEVGVLALAIESTLDHYREQHANLSPYLGQSLNTMSASLQNSTSDSKLPLDRFSVANALERQASTSVLSTNESRALEALQESFSLQPRNQEGGFWYYAAYPQWSYLDGMFSVLPFMAIKSLPSFTDIGLQISLLYSHCYQSSSGLLVHGYDASKTAVWADPVTGASPNVWGRSLGWYLAGLVQTYDVLCCSSGGQPAHDQKSQLCPNIQHIFSNLTTSLITNADPETGAWWDLTALPNETGNYLESSSTVLFIFSLLKGLRLEMISHDLSQPFLEAAKKAFQYTTGSFVVAYGNGTIGFDKTVSVSSLNSTASYEYYTGVVLNPNSLLGEGMFVMAALEIERL